MERTQLDRWLVRKPSLAPPNAKVIRLPVSFQAPDRRPFPWAVVLFALGVPLGVLIALGIAKAMRWM